VSLIKDRVFYFCVSTKEVGFHILKLRRFACAQFNVSFTCGLEVGPIGDGSIDIGIYNVKQIELWLVLQEVWFRRD
jgi:hypothetical protein